jgi:transposase
VFTGVRNDGGNQKRQRPDTDLETAYTLAQRFRHIMRAQVATALKPWLADCLASRMPELVNFAHGLQRELPAVQAALTLPCTNGLVEGQITKLKLLKRQSYGRAKLDLLRQRMLHAA